MIEREERRIAILRSAIEIFSQNGFYKSKIQEIAKNAGIGKGTIYQYFESKKQLFEEMIKYSIEIYSEDIIKIIEKNLDTREKILSFFKYHVKISHNYENVLQSIVNQSQSDDMMRHCLLELKTRLYKLIEQIIKEGIAKAELRKDLDVEIAVCSIVGTINQYSIQKVHYEKMNYDDLNLEILVEGLLKGLK